MSGETTITIVDPTFWSHVSIGSPDECWPYTAASNEDGYGITRREGQNHRAHRWAWHLATGEPLDPEVKVLHRCDNPPCVNPAHLFTGSQADNIADMHAKGRRSYSTRVSPEDVEAMRRLRSAGATVTSIATEFGISQPYASMLLSGERSPR